MIIYNFWGHNLEKEFEKIHQIQKVKDEMHSPKKMKVIHKESGELHALVDGKDDIISYAEAWEGTCRVRVENIWFSRTNKEKMEEKKSKFSTLAEGSLPTCTKN